MGEVVVPHLGFKPRDYQKRCWNALLKDNVKRAALCWHRRAGKDLLMLNIAQIFMLERSCLVWHLLPQFNQARRVVWNGITSEGHGFLDYFHPELIERRRDDQMLLQFKKEHGGSIYQCVGSDQPDKLMGANPSLVIFSEYALADPQCWDYIRPILNENDGVAAFISTPRGYNHFYDVMAQARESESWFSETLTVTDTLRADGTPVVTRELIEEDRRSGMPDELIRQEYYCDFSAPLTGAYWGRELDEAEREGRIGDVLWRREYPVHTAWDLGMRDATAIWFYQVVDGYVHWIDYYASSGEGLEHYAKVLQTKPYVYKEHWAPHDIRVRELGSGVSRWQTAADLGVFFRVVPRLSVEEGVQAARLVIPRSRFDKARCADGIKGLRHYRKEWDTHNRLWSAKPVHDWTSHCLTGDTEVLTRYGMCRIMDLPERGEVLTPCGWNPYRNPRISLRDAQLVEVTFDDGHMVRCTPDHLFLTENGWRSAENLTTDSLIQSSLILSRSFSRARCTGYGLASAISEIRSRFIEQCGRVLSDLFHFIATSTTGMKIRLTTCSQTLSVHPPMNTFGIPLSGNEPEVNARRSPRLAEMLSPRGIKAKKVAFGIADRPRDQRIGSSGSASRENVTSVGRFFRLWREKTGIRSVFATQTARLLRIAEVRRLNERADVWDITVPEIECFSLKNGAVVHNSADAFRGGCLTIPRGRVKVPEPIQWNVEETFDQALERSDALAKERRYAEQAQWKGI